MIVNNWGPGGSMGIADGGNSCAITAVGKFDITSISPILNAGWPRVRKIVEKNGDMFFLLPDGSKYTMTGIRVE